MKQKTKNKKILVSIVIPVLNEEQGILICLRQIKNLEHKAGMRKFPREIIVVDNGSTDKSMLNAKREGAKVVIEKKKGYGRALLAGLKKAKGDYLIFADGDGSYDFSETKKVLSKFLETDSYGCPKYDLVLGSRFLGRIQKNAMPFTHRYFGTPFLNFLFKIFSRQSFTDVNTGFRGIRKEAFWKLKLNSSGMEFASEMLFKAGKLGLKITEVPITYRKRAGKSKLSAFRDAWRHVKFLLLFCPNWLFIFPGGVFGGLGLLGVLGLSFGPIRIGSRAIDIHSMITASFMTLIGFQIVFLGFFAKVFAFNFLSEEDKKIASLLKIITLEKGIIVGLCFFLIGLGGFLVVAVSWYRNSFGLLSMERVLLSSLTFLVLGLEIVFSSFFFALMAKEER
jgi:glycosyltransferase involved in cell wall biosynthesis